MEGKIFKNTNEFALFIEKIVQDKKMTHMEAVLKYCEENYIDPEDISSLINKSLKQKIELNMIEANMLPKRGSLDLWNYLPMQNLLFY